MTWAMRRKLLYVMAFLALFSLVGVFLYYYYFYHAPTCFDGRKNGTETGVDCGGSCVKLCKLENIPPIVEWARAFNITDSGSTNTIYSLAAYVDNPNLDAGSSYSPYTFTVYDKKNNVVYTKEGVTIIPPGKRFVVFEGPISFATSTPYRTDFSFGDMQWTKMSRDDLVLKANQIRITRNIPPRIDASIENSSLDDIHNIESVAVVYDDTGNAIAVSRTLVDVVPKESSQNVVFTWPTAFPAQYASCEVPSDISLVIDRSGSMASDAANPPEPLTSVKEAAKTFVQNLGAGAKVGVISFSTTASVPAEQTFTSSSTVLSQSIDGILIKTGGVQETNIADALDKAGNLLNVSSSSLSSSTKKIIVLLTDGVPTLPKKNKEPGWPALSASAKSLELRQKGIEIYTIGLGKEVNDNLLKEIASGENHYYKAPSKDDLQAIYSKIATALCTKHPVIEIITRIFPQSS